MDKNSEASSSCSPRKKNPNQKMILNEQRNLLEAVTAQEKKFVDGELDLGEKMKKTDEMYSQIRIDVGMSNEALNDSRLIYKQSDILYSKAQNMKANSASFNPQDFAEKVKNYAAKIAMQRAKKKDNPSEPWLQLGDKFKTDICSSPSFHFMYGSFVQAPVELKNKTRVVRSKDIIGEEVKPKSVNLDSAQANQDNTTKEVERVHNILRRCYRKNNNEPLCYFDFITDPDSFSNTVENVFHVSFLIKDGYAKIISDGEGLPVIIPTKLDQNDPDNNVVHSCKQSVLSMSIEDWQNIIKTFKIRRSVLNRK